MGFSRHEYWSGLSCPPPGDLPDPGIEPTSLMSPALKARFFNNSTIFYHNKKKLKEKIIESNLHLEKRGSGVLESFL